MDYDEVFEKLKVRALDFHRVLTQTRIYKIELSETEFLQRTDDIIKRTAKNIVEGIGDPWVTVLGLPESLLFGLSDVIYTTTWDTEDGGEELFEQLRKLFEQTPFDFKWNFDPAQEKLNFKIDTITWSVPCKSLEQEELWIEPHTYSKLEPNLDNYLETQGWRLYPVTTGDQVVRFVLLPIVSIEKVKDYLISAYDPRGEWFYTGIPEVEKPPDIWSL